MIAAAGVVAAAAGMAAGSAGMQAGMGGMREPAPRAGTAAAPVAGMAAGASGAAAGMGARAAGSGGAGTGGAGSGAAAGRPGTGMCPHVPLKGMDVCTIGDSWIQIPGNQVTTLENHMKQAGVIPQGDRFDRREVSGSTLPAIIATYSNKPMNCKILIMDGGGIDLFTTAAGNQAAVMPVVQQFKDFLKKVEGDGYVQHILYSLYPVIPSTPNLNANMKPGFSEACAASAVDCQLVDLEPLFMGKYIGSDRTHADQTGGGLIGDAWWKAMQEHCIAQ
ncbi:MAG TPA: hypothetical protein VJV78_18555 [Polyangiales bacterium]|nr:hypothetical protein [Polyangiales bacterium]